MVTQRRYSVTGQTPPDDAEALKARSPKLQALDTSTTCGLCEASAEASSSPEPVVRGRQMSKASPIVRTSSKRSATQLPNSPSHELPPKIARYGLLQDAMDVDTDVDTDATTTSTTSTDSDWDATDQAPSHSLSPCSLPPDPDDYCMEHLALSPPHSRQHSLDCTEHARSWLQADTAASSTGYAAPTFLTLPPEIRHQIYRHCDELVFTQPLLYCIATAFDKIQHPLASVSRQVRSEALAIFYSYNTWTIKVEFKIMYDSFQHWIIRLGDGAGFLRLVDLSVRGTLFKPKRAHAQSVLLHGQLIQITAGVASNGREELYSPPDGDASFRIDLSEKHFGGKVQLLRNDGTKEAGDVATLYLESMVRILWDKRRSNNLNGQDWVSMVDQFLQYVGGWS